jgi:uncharacterized membrane-anchored protein YitT (DUF2179 family)
MSKSRLGWKDLSDFAFILVGSLIQALSMRLFLIPAQLVSGGVSGTAQIINYFTGWPIGLMVLLGNVPLFMIGWRYLGGFNFGMRTVFSIVIFSFFTDLLAFFTPLNGITTDIVLNCLYGAISLGIGLGLVYHGRGTSGGSDILGRILYQQTRIPLSQTYLITDALVVLVGGLAFGWEKALYGLLVIYISGWAAEMVSEGQGIFRTALIVTNYPDQVSGAILKDMERGVTILPGTGAYTGKSRPVLFCVVTRSEVSRLKELVHESDPKAFMVIGQANEALGEGFSSLKSD